MDWERGNLGNFHPHGRHNVKSGIYWKYWVCGTSKVAQGSSKNCGKAVAMGAKEMEKGKRRKKISGGPALIIGYL